MYQKIGTLYFKFLLTSGVQKSCTSCYLVNLLTLRQLLLFVSNLWQVASFLVLQAVKK